MISSVLSIPKPLKAEAKGKGVRYLELRSGSKSNKDQVGRKEASSQSHN